MHEMISTIDFQYKLLNAVSCRKSLNTCIKSHLPMFLLLSTLVSVYNLKVIPISKLVDSVQEVKCPRRSNVHAVKCPAIKCQEVKCLAFKCNVPTPLSTVYFGMIFLACGKGF